MTPNGWSRTSLGTIAELSGGTTPSRTVESFWDGDIYWATPSDITALPPAEMGIAKTAAKITRQAVEMTSLRMLEPGCVLMTSRATIGEAVINRVPITTNQGFCNFVPGRSVHPEFLVNWLRHSKRTLVALSGGSTFLEIGKQALRRLEIDLPPLPEQKKIAAILGSVDEAIAATQAVIDQTHKVKQGLLTQLLTRGIGHTRFKMTEVGEIPEEWEVQELRTVARVQTGLAKGKKGIDDPVELPYLRVANVQDAYLDLSEVKTIHVSRRDVERHRLRHGDVLLTEGGDLDKLGRGDMWRGQIEVCLHQNHVFAVRTDSSILLPEFFGMQASGAYGKRYFLGCAKQTTNLASINSTQLKQFPVLLPPIPEQERMVATLMAARDEEAGIEAALNQLDLMKRGLMQDLLTGRVRVKGAA